MPRPKRQTREERLQKRRLYEKRRKDRIKSNDVTREELLRKDRERYARKKAAGLILPRHELAPSKLKIIRRKNNVSATAYYHRKKNTVAAAPIVARADLEETIGNLVEDEPDQLSPNQSDVDNNYGLRTSRHSTPSAARACNTLRRSLRLINNDSISTNIQLESTAEALSSHRVYTSSPRQTGLSAHQFPLDNNYNNAGPNTSRQDDPASALRPTRLSVLRPCLRMNSDSSLSSDVQHDVDEKVPTITNVHCV